MPTIPNILAADLGTLFTYRDHQYVVTNWLKRMAPPEVPAGARDPFQDMLGAILYEAQQECGPDRARLVFCDRLEAEYVSGRGVSGCIARLADIEITGTADWSPIRLDEERQSSAHLVGRPIF